MIVVKVVRVGKFATFALFALLLLCLASLTFTLVRCLPDSIERDLEIDCKWNGAPVSASLKWTEPKDDPATTTNMNAGSKTSQSGAANSKVNTAMISTQQALMLTGAASGAALVGGGTLAVKKKLEGGNSETKQMASTSAISSTAPKGTPSASPSSGREMLMQHQNELKPSTQSQSSTQSQQTMQSNAQNPTKDDEPPTSAGQQYMQKQVYSQSSQQSQPTTQAQRLVQSDVQNYQKEPTSTLSTITASASTITKDLLMQKQMDSSKQACGTQQYKQDGASSTSTSTTSQNIGLLASSSSAAQIATEMWPQRQKEFERLAKQRSDLAAKFSTPSYSTGLASSLSVTGNAWARLQGFSSVIDNGINRMVAAIKPYTPYISMALCLALIVSSVFTFGATAPATGAAIAGAGISLGQGASLAGMGVGIGYGIYQLQYQMHNLGIMSYPQQPSFDAKHTQYIQQSTSEIKDAKGSGTYGVDPAKEQLDQANVGMDTIIQPHAGPDHTAREEKAIEWLKKRRQTVTDYQEDQYGVRPRDSIRGKKGETFICRPDRVTEKYILEVKTGLETDRQRCFDQALDYLDLAYDQGKTLIYWYDVEPKSNHWWGIIIDMLQNNDMVSKS